MSRRFRRTDFKHRTACGPHNCYTNRFPNVMHAAPELVLVCCKDLTAFNVNRHRQSKVYKVPSGCSVGGGWVDCGRTLRGGVLGLVIAEYCGVAGTHVRERGTNSAVIGLDTCDVFYGRMCVTEVRFFMFNRISTGRLLVGGEAQRLQMDLIPPKKCIA